MYIQQVNLGILALALSCCSPTTENTVDLKSDISGPHFYWVGYQRITGGRQDTYLDINSKAESGTNLKIWTKNILSPAKGNVKKILTLWEVNCSSRQMRSPKQTAQAANGTFIADGPGIDWVEVTPQTANASVADYVCHGDLSELTDVGKDPDKDASQRS